jgi:CxxC motif-containing protein
MLNEKNDKEAIHGDNGVREVKICCNTCPRQCEMTLLMEGFSILMVKDDGCKKGSKFAYKEIKNRKTNKKNNRLNFSEMKTTERTV